MIFLEESIKSLVYSLCVHLDEVTLMGLSSTAHPFSISHFLTGLLITTLQPELSTKLFKGHPFPALNQCISHRDFQIYLQTSFASLNNHCHPLPLLFATLNYLSIPQTCPSSWSLYKFSLFFLLFPS